MMTMLWQRVLWSALSIGSMFVLASEPIDVHSDASLTHIVNARGAHSIPRFVIASSVVDDASLATTTNVDDEQLPVVR